MAHEQYWNLISALGAYAISVGSIGLVLIILYVYERRR